MTRALPFATALVLLLSTTGLAGDWPNFLGPNYDLHSDETGLKADWSAAPPRVWDAEVGSAFSGLSCVDGRVYTCGTASKKQVLLCFDADTGKKLWQTPIEDAYFEAQGGSGTRATPTVSDGRVYVLGALGRLICATALDGKILWEKKFDGPPQWGFSGSVLIDGNLAIVSIGGKHGALVAFDKVTSVLKWKTGSQPVGYATPYPFTLEGERYICGFMGESAIVVRARDGKQVWELPFKTDYNVNAASPIFHDGCLLLSAGYGHGSVLVRLSRNGEKLTHKVVWEGKALLCKFQSPLLHEGYLYCSDDQGFKCVEFATGAVKWRTPRIEHGTLVMAESRLFLLTEKGEWIIAPASPDKFEPISRVPLLDDRCWTAPTLYRGRVYARNLDRIACFSLR